MADTPFALAMFFQNEEEWLTRHLPVLTAVTKLLDVKLIGLDGGSDDNSAHVWQKFGGELYYNEFVNFGAQANQLLRLCRMRNARYVLRLDADELMFPEEMVKVLLLLGGSKTQSVQMRRYNFEGDAKHWCMDIYPDWQIRGINATECWYKGKVHERLICKNPLQVDYHIYHYEGLKTSAFRMWKNQNYARRLEGKKDLSFAEYCKIVPTDKLPAVLRKQTKFTKKQPLGEIEDAL